jgi:hypothetical protein
MRTVVCALLVGSIAGAPACATRDAQPQHGGSAAAAETKEEVIPTRYREMTWAEYYTEVTERMWRRGGTVIWISPPNVRKGKRTMLVSDPP